MQKVKNFIEKHDNLMMTIIILIAVFAPSLYFYLLPYDSLWNFGNIYKLYLGRTIYQEVNIIISPFFFWLGVLVFKIIGANIFAFKIYTIIMMTIFYFLLYRILITLKINKKISAISTIMILAITNNTFAANGANYNILAISIVMIAFLVNIKMQENTYKNIIQGILLTLIFLTYQKAGAGYAITLIIIQLLKENKNIVKIKSLTITFVSTILSLSIFLLYEFFTNNLNYFIDMSVLGIKDFGQNNSSADYLRIAEIVSLAILTIIFVKKINTISEVNYKNTIKKILSFATGNFLICIPIFNLYHIELAMTFIEIAIIYSINYCIGELFTEKLFKKIANIIIIIAITLFIEEDIRNSIIYIPYLKEKNNNYNSIYYGAIIEEDLQENINTINNYIIEQKKDGKKVIIFSTYAMLYEENYKTNNGYFDLPNKGNFGKGGENEIKKQISKLKNTIILVQNKERSKYEMYQFPNDTRQYIQDNFEKIGEIENYDIYEIK